MRRDIEQPAESSGEQLGEVVAAPAPTGAVGRDGDDTVDAASQRRDRGADQPIDRRPPVAELEGTEEVGADTVVGEHGNDPIDLGSEIGWLGRGEPGPTRSAQAPGGHSAPVTPTADTEHVDNLGTAYDTRSGGGPASGGDAQ